MSEFLHKQHYHGGNSPCFLLQKTKRRRVAGGSDVEENFSGRVLPFWEHVYAFIAAERRKGGRPIPHFDAQIAATSLLNNTAIATRDVPTSTAAASR